MRCFIKFSLDIQNTTKYLPGCKNKPIEVFLSLSWMAETKLKVSKDSKRRAYRPHFFCRERSQTPHSYRVFFCAGISDLLAHTRGSSWWGSSVGTFLRYSNSLLHSFAWPSSGTRLKSEKYRCNRKSH
jgi:hypothetical protein